MGELGLWGIAGAPAWVESVLPTARISQVATTGPRNWRGNCRGGVGVGGRGAGRVMACRAETPLCLDPPSHGQI